MLENLCKYNQKTRGNAESVVIPDEKSLSGLIRGRIQFGVNGVVSKKRGTRDKVNLAYIF